MKREKLNIRINDRFLLGEIDYSLHTVSMRYSFPDAINTLLFIEKVFTSHLNKRFRDKPHYLRSFVAKKYYPALLELLRQKELELREFYEATKKESTRMTHYREIYRAIEQDNKSIELKVLITPPVMLFISIIAAVDNIIKQLRVQYKSGVISKRHLYRQRNIVLKKFSNVRLALYRLRKEHDELLEKILKIG